MDKVREVIEKKRKRKLTKIAEKEQIGFVYGKGRRKSEIRQLMETSRVRKGTPAVRFLPFKQKDILEILKKMTASDVSTIVHQRRYIMNSCGMQLVRTWINIIVFFMMGLKNLKEKQRKRLHRKNIFENAVKGFFAPQNINRKRKIRIPQRISEIWNYYFYSRFFF